MADTDEVNQLAPKQAMFVREYLIDLNGTQAAIRAGYSPRTANEQASRLLANANIARLIQDAMDKRAKKLDISAEYVLGTIRNTIERCRQAEQVTEKDGTVSGEYKFDSGAVLKGCELLGKHLKLFTDKIEHGGDGGGAVKIITSEMSPQDAARAYADFMAAGTVKKQG